MGIRVQSDEALEELRALLDRIILDLESIEMAIASRILQPNAE